MLCSGGSGWSRGRRAPFLWPGLDEDEGSCNLTDSKPPEPPANVSTRRQAADRQQLHTGNTIHLHGLFMQLQLTKMFFFLFSQIFIKLIYFEPVVREPTFAALQWVLLYHLPFHVVEMMRCVKGDLSLFLYRDLDELCSVPEMAFYGLKLLCLPKHGDQKNVRSKDPGCVGQTCLLFVRKPLMKYNNRSAGITNMLKMWLCHHSPKDLSIWH